MDVMRAAARAAVGIIEAAGWSPSITLRSGVGAGLKLGLGTALQGSYGRGTYEMPVQEVLKAHLRTGDVAVDVGANIGFFTLIAAHLVGSTGHVYAIEPVPDNAEAIRRNLARNGFHHGTVIEAGAGNESGRARLMIADHPGGATLSEQDTPPDLRGEIEIDTVRLDDLLESRRLEPPDFVKIDVEGFEIEVIEGMTRLFADHSPILLIEIDAPTRGDLDVKHAQVLSALGKLGYGVRSLQPSYASGPWAVDHLLAERENAHGPTSRP